MKFRVLSYFNRWMLGVFFLVIVGCSWGGDYAISLYNGYRLIKSNSRERVIVNSRDVVVVPGNIEALGFQKPWVFGRKSAPSDWFVLNTETGKLFSARDQNKVKSFAIQEGVTAFPEVHKVWRFLAVPK